MFQKLTDKFIPNTKEASSQYRARIGIFQGKISIAVNSFLFIIKFTLGLITGAISLIADAIHTLSDMITSLIVIWGFKQSDKPADSEHPYGHGRAEYVATLISPSNAKKPPIKSVAVNPNNIAIRIIGINAAESFIAW